MCYSSSARDGGVRSKVIDLTSGRWDVVDVEIDKDHALAWFLTNNGDKYDWAGIWRFVIPFLPQGKRRWFCFEAIGSALGFAGAHKLTANDLHRWSMEQRSKIIASENQFD